MTKPAGTSFHLGAGSDHGPKPTVKWIPSPNCASRQGHGIDTLVLHNTDAPLQSTLDHFKGPVSTDEDFNAWKASHLS